MHFEGWKHFQILANRWQRACQITSGSNVWVENCWNLSQAHASCSRHTHCPGNCLGHHVQRAYSSMPQPEPLVSAAQGSHFQHHLFMAAHFARHMLGMSLLLLMIQTWTGGPKAAAEPPGPFPCSRAGLWPLQTWCMYSHSRASLHKQFLCLSVCGKSLVDVPKPMLSSAPQQLNQVPHESNEAFCTCVCL